MAGLRKFQPAETARQPPKTQIPSLGIQHGGFKEIYTKVLDDLAKNRTGNSLWSRTECCGGTLDHHILTLKLTLSLH